MKQRRAKISKGIESSKELINILAVFTKRRMDFYNGWRHALDERDKPLSEGNSPIIIDPKSRDSTDRRRKYKKIFSPSLVRVFLVWLNIQYGASTEEKQ